MVFYTYLVENKQQATTIWMDLKKWQTRLQNLRENLKLYHRKLHKLLDIINGILYFLDIIIV